MEARGVPILGPLSWVGQCVGLSLSLDRIESKEEEGGRRKVALDLGVGTGLGLSSFPRPHLWCSRTLGPFPAGLGAPPFPQL